MTILGTLLKNKRAGGENRSPALAWSGAPASTAQLLLVVQDIDSPTRTPFVHCVALPTAITPAEGDATLDTAKPRAVLATVSGPALARGRLDGLYTR